MKKIRSSIFIAFLTMLVSHVLVAQNTCVRIDSIPVKIAGNTLKMPWAGGINFPELSAVDLNGDGIKDLVVFDKSGNKIRTFINHGAPNKVDYSYAPQYEKAFPSGLNQFVLMADYNCDGKEDIFTYSNGGMALYRNDYTVANGLKFTLVTSLIRSQYYNKSLNLYVSLANIPAIADIDNDGDLDILTFEVGGSYIEYHKNMSMETYGNCDSLNYVFDIGCWGHFTGNSTSNSVTLNANCKGAAPSGSNATNHSGSTLLTLDMDGDGDKEMIIGDVISNNLLLVTNGGTLSNANMIAQDDSFPSNSKAASLTTFPASFFLDVNNDGKRDLLVAPNAPNVSENFKSIWYYENTGTDAAPVFTFRQNDFLQNEMIETGEGNSPVFFDYDGDGLLDLIIGNETYFAGTQNRSGLSLYKNIGTITAPGYELVTRDFAGINSLNLRGVSPTFGDLDGDGDKDLIIGEEDGNLFYYVNSAATGQPAKFDLSASGYKGIDVGQHSAPQLVDVNRDGKLDLLVGERNGNLNYYQNTGSKTNADFTLVTAAFGNVKTSSGYTTGYAIPYLFDINGSYKLLVGSESGGIYYYDNIDGNLAGSFNRIDTMFQKIKEGAYTSISGGDINNDGKIELLIGNYGGGTAIYSTDFPKSTDAISENIFKGLDIKAIPNPGDNVCVVKFGKMIYNTGIHVNIYNLLGQQQNNTVTASNTDAVTLDTKGLADGVYICRITINDKSEVLKLVIQH